MKTLVVLSLLAATAYAQFDSPVPPRFNIPGAVQVGARPINFRQGRVQNAPVPGAPRIRRPGLSRPTFKSVDAPQRPSLQSLEETAKPVTEEPEEDLLDFNAPTGFTTGSLFSTPEPQNDIFESIQTTTGQPKLPLSFNPNFFAQSTPSIPKAEPTRAPSQFRPEPAPVRNELPFKQQPVRLQPLSIRPQRPRPASRPQFIEDDETPIQPVRQYNRPPEQPAFRQPIKSAPVQKYIPTNSRDKKPVAQVINKYRDDNPDGSITWGFENDDGSFKEETIGVDCITRGKYGYVDPDGLKREYSYETGIACDKTKEDQQEKGFIDYQENKAVLPNGVTIDLAAMGKKSKRPFRSPSIH